MQMNRLIPSALLLALVALTATAQVQSAKGMATVSYRDEATPEVKAQAFHDAEVNAVERYFAESGASQSDNFDVIRAKVSGAIGSYVLGATVISEENRPDARQYSVVVRADINASRLSNELKNSSTVANTADQQKSPLTFVFVARAQDSVKAFDPHVYKRTDEKVTGDASGDVSKSGTEGEKIGRSQISTNASTSSHIAMQASTSNIVETGGSTTRRADQVTWALIPSANLSSIVTGIFGSAGFQVVEAEYVEPQSNGLLSLQALQSDYKTGNDLQPQTMRNTVQGLQAAQVPYLALATLDVGLPGTDPQTGLTVVYVTVTGKIVDVTGRFPRTVASVGPEQFAGTGPSSDVAQTNGLKLAADKAARELVSQVNVVGVH
jgi:hypothetical protein